MKFTVALLIAAATALVSAETNAERLARGLPPNAPGKRATPALRARRGTPSGSPGQCNTGPIQCCSSTSKVGDEDEVDQLLDLLGLNVDLGVLCGLNCSPITVVGLGGGCQQQPVCCENNDYNGLINIGCSPINL